MMNDHTGWTGYHLNLGDRPDPSTAPVRELIVALDGSNYAERSLEVADALAAAADLPLRVVTMRPSRAAYTSTQSYLERVTRRIPRVSDLAFEITDDVGGALAAAADDGGLVVLATHARRAVGEVLFGSVADRVLRVSSRPVLLVGPKAGVPDSGFATMVVPDDGGPGSRALRPMAKAWSEHLSSVPWVVQVLSGPGGDPSMDVLEAAHLQGIATSMRPGAEWEVLHGDDPADQIVAFAATHRAGLIAMPVPARHRVGLDVAGGVALKVVRHAPCPVLALGQAER